MRLCVSCQLLSIYSTFDFAFLSIFSGWCCCYCSCCCWSCWVVSVSVGISKLGNCELGNWGTVPVCCFGLRDGTNVAAASAPKLIWKCVALVRAVVVVAFAIRYNDQTQTERGVAPTFVCICNLLCYCCLCSLHSIFIFIPVSVPIPPSFCLSHSHSLCHAHVDFLFFLL